LIIRRRCDEGQINFADQYTADYRRPIRYGPTLWLPGSPSVLSPSRQVAYSKQCRNRGAIGIMGIADPEDVFNAPVSGTLRSVSSKPFPTYCRRQSRHPPSNPMALRVRRKHQRLVQQTLSQVPPSTSRRAKISCRRDLRYGTVFGNFEDAANSSRRVWHPIPAVEVVCHPPLTI
jgi:hypothetical protein